MSLRAVIFDLDGAVVENSCDWPLIKRAIGSGDRPILEHIHGLESPEREKKLALLEEFAAEQTARAARLDRVFIIADDAQEFAGRAVVCRTTRELRLELEKLLG